jgi:hypothetical protein
LSSDLWSHPGDSGPSFFDHAHHQEIAAFRGADKAPDYRLPYLQILFGRPVA